MASPFRPDVLAGKRVLITGGGTGLGELLGQALCAHGAHVVIWGRRETVLAAAAEKMGGAFQVVDVRDADAVDAAMQEIWDTGGPLNAVVNGAAANFIAPTKDLSARAYEAVNSTVQDGSFFTTLSAGKRWIDGGNPGHVLSLLTTWIWSGSAFVTSSAMGKAAVHAMTMSLAVEWARYGVRLNALAPGPFPTEYAWQMLAPTDDVAVGATDAAGVPLGRHGEPEELQNLVVFLMSDACDYMTGATIPVDGGQRLAAPSTFSGLTALDDTAWERIRETAKAASAQSKEQRS